MCCRFCFSTDQQLDATACKTHKLNAPTLRRLEVSFLFSLKHKGKLFEVWWWDMTVTHRFLEGAVQPAVVDHILDGDWWILQVLKWIHQDEVQHYVIEVQVFHLVRINKKCCHLKKRPTISVWTSWLVYQSWMTSIRYYAALLPLVLPAPTPCFPSALCAPGRKSSPQTLPQISLGSGNQTVLIGTEITQWRRLILFSSCRFSLTFCALIIMEDNIFFPVSARNILVVLSHKMSCRHNVDLVSKQKCNRTNLGIKQ